MRQVLAVFMFFTRLPLWRLATVPAECFKHVVPYWPLAGWLTGGVMAAVVWLAAQVLPLPMAWLCAIVARLLLTGCLHEDGLADLCDGFGGGTSRDRVLAIMKDSHIGTYGVVGLIFYFMLFAGMSALPAALLPAVAFCGDVYSKWCASHIINLLPYARREEDSKARVTYSRMSVAEAAAGAAAALLPVALLLPAGLLWACAAPPAVVLLMCRLMRRRIGGYTGDCCGALFLLCELSFHITALALVWN